MSKRGTNSVNKISEKETYIQLYVAATLINGISQKLERYLKKAAVLLQCTEEQCHVSGSHKNVCVFQNLLIKNIFKSAIEKAKRRLRSI